MREAAPRSATVSAAPPATATGTTWLGLIAGARLATGSANSLTGAAAEGFATEFVAQARQRLSGDRLTATLQDLGTGDHLSQFYGGLTGGSVAGFVSPVTDLLGLGVLAEQAPMIASALARKAYAGVEGLAAEFEGLGRDVAAFKAEARVKLREILLDPARIAEILARIGPQAEQTAREAGAAAARTIVGVFESAPEKEHPRPASLTDALSHVKEGDLAGGLSLVTSRATNVREYVFRAPWARTGYDVGHTVGAVVSNLLLLAFSDGVGNALAKIGAWVGEIAPLLARGAEGLAALGRGIAAAEALIGQIVAKGVSAIKPLEALLTPLFKLLGRFRRLLQRLAGVTEHVLERAATAEATSVTDEALERGAAAARRPTAAAKPAAPKLAAAPKPAAPKPAAPKPAMGSGPTSAGTVSPLERPVPPPRSAVSRAQDDALANVPKGRGDVHRIRPTAKKPTAAPASSTAPHPEAAAAAKPEAAVLEDAASRETEQRLAPTGTGGGRDAAARPAPAPKPKLTVVGAGPGGRRPTMPRTLSGAKPVVPAPARRTTAARPTTPARPATPPAAPARTAGPTTPAGVPEEKLAELERRIDAVADERLFDELKGARSSPDGAQRVKDLEKRLDSLEAGPRPGRKIDPGTPIRNTPGKSQPKRYGVGNFTHENLEHLRPYLNTRRVPPEFRAALRDGRIITLDQMPNGLKPEQRIGVTARVDRMGNAVIYEIKPNTARSLREGLRRVEEYVKLANAQRLGGHANWTGKVVVYDWKEAQRFIP